MNCPACLESMFDERFLEVEVNRCHTCGGLWLDAGELARYVSSGSIPDELLENYAVDKDRDTIREGERACARCGERLRVVKHMDISLDFCPWCHGIWFDAHELKTILIKYYEEEKFKGKARPGIFRPRKGTHPQNPQSDDADIPVDYPLHADSDMEHKLKGELFGGLTGEEVVRSIPNHLLPVSDENRKLFTPLKIQQHDNPMVAQTEDLLGGRICGGAGNSSEINQALRDATNYVERPHHRKKKKSEVDKEFEKYRFFGSIIEFLGNLFVNYSERASNPWNTWDR